MTVCRLLQSPPPDPFAAVVASLEQFSSRCPYPYPEAARTGKCASEQAMAELAQQSQELGMGDE